MEWMPCASGQQQHQLTKTRVQKRVKVDASPVNGLAAGPGNGLFPMSKTPSRDDWLVMDDVHHAS